MPEISVCWAPFIFVFGGIAGVFLLAVLRMAKAGDPVAGLRRGEKVSGLRLLIDEAQPTEAGKEG